MSSEKERIIAALRLIKSRKIDILNENVRVCAMLSDIEPELKRERRRIKAVYETGAVQLIARALAVSTKNEAAAYLNNAAQVLIEDADMTDDAAAESINYFAAVWYGLPTLDERSSARLPSAKINRDFVGELSFFSDSTPKGAFSDSVAAFAAEQLSAELITRYGMLLQASEKHPRIASLFCSVAMLLLPYFPKTAGALFEKAVRLGGKDELSLVGRQILSWHDYLGYEAALGFAMVKKGVDMGSKKGYLTLGYCYHNAVGICRCRELAEKYYHLASSISPECHKITQRYIDRLFSGRDFDDGLWRFY